MPGPFDDLPDVRRGTSDPFADLPSAEKQSGDKPLKGSVTAGLVEAGMSVGSNVAATVGAVPYAAFSDDPGGVIEAMQEEGTYQPRTQRGKDITKIINAPFEGWDQFAEYLGEKNREYGKSPLFGAAVKTVVDALPMLLGRPKGRAAEARAQPSAERPVAQPAPAAPPPPRDFPVAPETGVREEGRVRQTKAAPGAATTEDPFSDLPNAGNLEDVAAFKPQPRAPSAAELIAQAPEKPMEPTGGPEVLQRVKERAAEVEKDFRLEGESEDQFRDRMLLENRERAAAKAKEAAPPAEEFTLAGSDRPADQAAARGQMELTEAPQRVEKESAPPESITGESMTTKVRPKREGAPASILQAIKAKGGINIKEILDLTGEGRTGKKGISPGLFTKGGTGLDDLATRLRDDGFAIPEDAADGGVQALRDMIQDELAGRRKHYSFADQERINKLEAEKEAKARAAEEEEFEEATKGQTEKLDDEEALRRFGPGTLGMNAAMNPEVIKQAAKDMKAGAQQVISDTFGVPGAYRNLYGPIRDLEQHNVARIDRWAAGESYQIKRAFPDKAAREDLTGRLVRGDLSGLTGVQLEVAQKLKQNYQQMGEYAVKAEQLDGLRQNYSPQIWDINDKRTRRLIQMWRDARDAGPIRETSPFLRDPSGSGSFSPFTLQRSISDVFEGMKLGMKPASLDAAELFTTYARSMGRSVERSKAMSSLHQLMSDDGQPMVMPMKQAPRGYVPIRYPELEGYAVHPDIAPAVRVVLESDTPGAIPIALQSLAYASKRGLVSYSFFHPTSLFLAWKGTLPLGRLVDFNAKGAIDAALKKYREGGPGDAVDKLLAGGLKIGAPMDDLMGRERFGRVMDKAERMATKLNLGGAIRVPRQLDRALQHATWDYVQTGFKLDVATRFFEDALLKNADKIAKGEITEADVARQAAESANAIEGGLNWERMIDKFDTPVGRRIMADILSKNGRRWMQTFAFAPDWLVSTVSSWTNAVTGGEQAAVRRALARRYLAMSAVITYSFGNALNYYFTGHSMFENRSGKKDATWLDDMKAKTEVSLGHGLRLNPNKHFLEVPHAAADPVQFLLNKANPLTVGEPLEQLFNKEWLSTGWAPEITPKSDSKMKGFGKRALHATEKVLPITGRAVMEQGVPGISGFLGFPISGVSDEQKERERDRRLIERANRP